MTVTTSANKAILAGNGVQTSFGFTFNAGYAQGAPSPATALSYLAVIATDSSGNQTTVAQGSGTNQCQITLNAPVAGALWGLGGTVAYDPAGTPLPAGSTLTVLRTVPLTQLVSLSNQGGLFPQTVEMALDLLEFQIQQLNELYGRALVAPAVDPSAPLPLPPAAQRANLALLFDASGNPTAGSIPASGIISSAMQPVVDAATVALGRAALGLGTMAQEGIGAGLQDDGAGNARVNFTLVQISSGETIAAANHLTQIVATGPLTLTLSKTTTLWNGFGFLLKVSGAAVTLAPNAADIINYAGAASGGSVALAAGSRALITCDGNGNWDVYNLGVAPPTQSVLTSGTGATYAVKAGCTRLRIRMAGDGGGGSGAGSVGNGNGTTGSGTTFNGVTAAGGGGSIAATGGGGGSGGAGGTGGAGSASLRVQGNGGASGWATGSATGNVTFISPGGASLFAGTSTTAPPIANSGAGGAGGHSNAVNAGNGGGGGGGEYVEFTILPPLAASYTYTVGPGGAAGALGTGGTAGNTGASGLIIVDEYYDAA